MFFLIHGTLQICTKWFQLILSSVKCTLPENSMLAVMQDSRHNAANMPTFDSRPQGNHANMSHITHKNLSQLFIISLSVRNIAVFSHIHHNFSSKLIFFRIRNFRKLSTFQDKLLAQGHLRNVLVVCLYVIRLGVKKDKLFLWRFNLMVQLV